MPSAAETSVEVQIALARELLLEAARINGVQYLDAEKVSRIFATAKAFIDTAEILRADVL